MNVQTIYGPATLITSYISHDGEVLVFFSRRDYDAGLLTVEMSGPGLYKLIPKEQVTDGRQESA